MQISSLKKFQPGPYPRLPGLVSSEQVGSTNLEAAVLLGGMITALNGKIKMTIAELISELRATRGLFSWEFQGSSKVIHALLKTGDTAVWLDPLRAVSFIKTQKIFDEAHWVEACDAVGLSSRECSDVVEASNNYLQEQVEGSLRPDIYKQWLRRQLIFAVGLHSVPNRK